MASTDVVTDADSARGLENLSPFELKDKLIEYAKDFSQEKSATRSFLNADDPKQVQRIFNEY